jgi:hypothetical protein
MPRLWLGNDLGREADFSTSLRFGRNDDVIVRRFGRNDDVVVLRFLLEVKSLRSW